LYTHRLAPPGADFMRHWRHTINASEWPRQNGNGVQQLDGRCHKMRGRVGTPLPLWHTSIVGCAICSRARSVYHPGLILGGHGFH